MPLCQRLDKQLGEAVTLDSRRLFLTVWASSCDDLCPDLLDKLHSFLLYRSVHLNLSWRVEDLLHLFSQAVLIAFASLMKSALDLGKPAWEVKIINFLAYTILLTRCELVQAILQLPKL